MTVNRNKVNFFTGDPIDKIVYQSPEPVSIVNSGATGSAQSARIEETRIANPYGKKALCRFRFSVDGGVSYNGQDAHLAYTYTNTDGGGSTTLGGLRAAVSIGVSATEIIIRTANGYHGNVSFGAYTPISQTFLIEYALYEVE